MKDYHMNPNGELRPARYLYVTKDNDNRIIKMYWSSIITCQDAAGNA
jgi:hypothetical protein